MGIGGLPCGGGWGVKDGALEGGGPAPPIAEISIKQFSFIYNLYRHSKCKPNSKKVKLSIVR